MKITDIRTFSFNAEARNWLFVKVCTDEGIWGWGESSLEWNDELVLAAIEVLKPRLIGGDPRESEKLWRIMARGPYWSGGPALGSAVAGIDLALWDIRGKLTGWPVYRLLGGPVRDRVRAYVSTLQPAEKTVELASEWRSRGFNAFKSHALVSRDSPLDFRAVDRQAQLFAKVRASVGPDVDLMLDCLGLLMPPVAVAFAKALAPHGLLFLEEPVSTRNVESFAAVSKQCPIPVAAGEHILDRSAAIPVLKQRAVAVLQPDISHAHGMTEVHKIAALCEAEEILIAPHSSCGPINFLAGAHLGMATHNYLIQECPAYAVRFYEKICEPRIRFTEGSIVLDENPGWGIELNDEYLGSRPPMPSSPPQHRYRDGGWAGW